jgi:hypothetical protein
MKKNILRAKTEEESECFKFDLTYIMSAAIALMALVLR